MDLPRSLGAATELFTKADSVMNGQEVLDQTILLTKTGSRAYGLNLETSDHDEHGVCVVPDPKYYIGLQRFDHETFEWPDGVDRTIRDLRSFIRLALHGVPNVIEMLFVDSSDVLRSTEHGRRLLENRQLFLSKHVIRALQGYAGSQASQIKNMLALTAGGPITQPELNDFTGVVPMLPGAVWEASIHGNHIKIEAASSFKVMTPAIITYTNKSDCDAATDRWQRYNEHLKKDSDCFRKKAMHMLRLSRMALEVAQGKGMIVRRPDAAELMSVRKGSRTFEDVLKEYSETAEEIDRYLNISELPSEADHEKAEDLMMGILRAVVKF